MEIYRIREEVDSLDLQNVENLTNNMKTACPTLDNTELNSYIESTSDYLKDSDDKENHDISNENSFDRISRRPVESWKYLPLKAENNRTSYKCSLCSSVYQHKKSLNKHWKDKHSANNSVSCPDRMNENSQSMYAGSGAIICQNKTDMSNFSLKNEPSVSLFPTSEELDNKYSKVHRKRMSLQLDSENKENVQSKRMSLMQPLSVNNLPLVLRSNNNMVKFVNNIVINSNFHNPASSESTENILDLRKPNNGALDLRTSSKSVALNRMIFRCFQCTFRSGTMFELNEHFKLSHMQILLGVKSFQVPVNLYQKLLTNQFNAIIRTESEPIETFNSLINCNLCGIIFPTRYDMIQHIGAVHEMEMVWICLVCGYGCCHPIQLSHHFQSHSNIQMLSKPISVCSWPSNQINPLIPCNIAANSNINNITTNNNNNNNNNNSNNNSNPQIEKFIPPDFENHLASSTPISANKYKRITSKKEPQIPDSFSIKEKTLKCLVCDATARWRSELFTHMITHSEHRSFGCKFCSYRSKWKWDVPKHLKRCRLAPANVRKPDVQNSYLITLLQHYSPPPGDILYQFMKEYNIKDIGSLNKSICVKNENDESFHNPDPSSASAEIDGKLEMKLSEIDLPQETAYEAISDISNDLDVDVGTDLVLTTKENSSNSETALKYTFKRCPWCQAFLTNKPSEMSNHLAQYHGDVESSHS